MSEKTTLPWPKRVCIDFDGVIHSYTSKWQGPEIISDPPVPGAFEAIEEYLKAGFKVAVYSSRNAKPGATKAMMDWFFNQGVDARIVDSLEFPHHKPAAEVYIDDRGYHFTGTFPTVEFLQSFKPWNK